MHITETQKQEILEWIDILCEYQQVHLVGLTGSRVRGYSIDESDFDVIFVFRRGDVFGVISENIELKSGQRAYIVGFDPSHMEKVKNVDWNLCFLLHNDPFIFKQKNMIINYTRDHIISSLLYKIRQNVNIITKYEENGKSLPMLMYMHSIIHDTMIKWMRDNPTAERLDSIDYNVWFDRIKKPALAQQVRYVFENRKHKEQIRLDDELFNEIILAIDLIEKEIEVIEI